MVDDMMAYLASVDDRPVWTAVPPEVQTRLNKPLPRDGEGEESAYADFVRDVLPYPVGNIHPRFWGWVIGSGTPFGALTELLASTMNPNVSGLQGSPRYVEDQVHRWLATMLGYSVDASGILVSGGSMANFVGLATGLVDRAGFDIARDGLVGAPQHPIVYASTETHFSVPRAVRLLGLGDAGYRPITVDHTFRIDLDALRGTIAADRREGHRPAVLIGNAGTVNTGACDDLEALADLAAAEDLWFHVDGAFGAFAALDSKLAPLVHGMDRADSLAFDLHKWMVIPIEAGSVLIRDPEAHRKAFQVTGAYVESIDGGIGQDGAAYAERGIQLTRGFRALKIWMAIKAYGADAFGDLVSRNVRLAHFLAERLRAMPSFEVVAPVSLNIVCFRYRPEDTAEAELDGLNRRLVIDLQEQGIAAPSHTTLGGRFVLRVCITNHRTQERDLDALLDGLKHLVGHPTDNDRHEADHGTA